jgi:hypothetical protein
MVASWAVAVGRVEKEKAKAGMGFVAEYELVAGSRQLLDGNLSAELA